MTKIEWCNHTTNVVDGCSPESEGCRNCWAARQYGAGRLQHVSALVRRDDGVPTQGTKSELVTCASGRPVYNGRVALNTDRLRDELHRIPRSGGKAGRLVFWNSGSDTFHESLNFDEIGAQFAVMAVRRDLCFLVLTKRPLRARAFFLNANDCHGLHGFFDSYRRVMGGLSYAALKTHERAYSYLWPLPNIAIGVSAENQQRWDERVPVLLDIPSAYKFVSAEPLLGPIQASREQLRKLDQVIIGAESGPGARACEYEWIDSLAGSVLRSQWHLTLPFRRDSSCQLFIKQADVCQSCCGHGYRPGLLLCEDCNGTGKHGTVIKNCPVVSISGNGRKSWAQHFWGHGQ